MTDTQPTAAEQQLLQQVAAAYGIVLEGARTGTTAAPAEPSGAAPAAAGPTPDTPDGGTLDLEAIEARARPDVAYGSYQQLAASADDVPALVAEVRRLRIDVEQAQDRTALAETAAAEAQRGPAPPGGPAVLGRALLDCAGELWPEHRRRYVEQTYPPVREVLLVSPAAGRVLDAARRWRDGYLDGDGLEYTEVRRALVAAVDALDGDQPDGPLADLPDAERAAFVALAEGRQPAPKPDSGPEWDRDYIQWMTDHLVAGTLGSGLQGSSADQLRALLADRDVQASDAVALRRQLRRAESGQRYAEQGRNATGTKLGQVSIELEETRADRLHWQARAELAESRLDGQAWADLTAERDQLHAARAELREVDRLHAELAEVTADRDGRQRLVESYIVVHRGFEATIRDLRAELATARRDAAADALDWAVDTAAEYRWTNVKLSQLAEWAAEVRAGTRPVPGSPQPADGGGDDG